jgi:hypothetical protein
MRKEDGTREIYFENGPRVVIKEDDAEPAAA